MSITEIKRAPRLAVDLLKGLLVVHPSHRLTAGTALEQGWFTREVLCGTTEGDEDDVGHGQFSSFGGQKISVKKGAYKATKAYSVAVPQKTLRCESDLEDMSAREDGNDKRHVGCQACVSQMMG